MKTLRSGDFSHLQEEGKPNLYGETNYAVYVDADLPVSGTQMTGGYGVLLNGSDVRQTGAGDNQESFSSGYIFQFDPGAAGLLLRYFYYPENRVNSYEQVGNVAFGVRPMYFYDAAKPNYWAPKEISYFSGTTGVGKASENFNLNAGAAVGDNINYRLPFLAINQSQQYGANTYYYDQITPTGGDRRDLGLASQPNSAVYGMTTSTANGYNSVYFPKLMQSWHKYPGTTVTDMLTGRDNRIGYR
jgi:hypothetical protein